MQFRQDCQQSVHRELASAQQEHQARDSKLQTTNCELELLQTNLLKGEGGQHAFLLREHLTHKALELKKSVAESQNEVDLCRDKLVTARQECRVLESLKENQLKEFNRDLSAREQKENDELAGYQYQKAKASGGGENDRD